MNKMNLFVVFAFAFAAVGCGAIPNAYRGQFVDPNTGATLVLGGSKGAFNSKTQNLQSKASDLKFDNLLQGKPGIYVAMTPGNKKMLEIYWLTPKLETAQQAGGMMWFESDIIQTLADATRKDKVPYIELFQCHDGTVMLDLTAKTWQVGCPANPYRYVMKRVQK